MICNVHHTFRNVRVLINWFSQIAVIVNVHCASRNFPFSFLVRRLPFICGRVAAVKLLGFAADRMVRDACMLVQKGNKIRQGWEMLALCFQVIGQCGKLVLKWP